MSDHDLLVRIDERLETVEKIIDRHETKICELQTGFLQVLGIGAVIGVITGFFGGKFGGS
jgi:hypothetical protein